MIFAGIVEIFSAKMETGIARRAVASGRCNFPTSFLRCRSMSPSLRAAVLSEWRGLPERRSKPDRWQEPGELLPKLMQQLGLRDRLREAEVIDAWKAIVGEFIAAHSAPVSLREGILFVRVLQPSLHYQFETISKAEILRKLKQRFGARVVRDVKFRVG